MRELLPEINFTRVADTRFHAHIVRDRSGLAHILETHTVASNPVAYSERCPADLCGGDRQRGSCGEDLVSATIRDLLRAARVPRWDPVLMVS
jgi:hypothetical protein